MPKVSKFTEEQKVEIALDLLSGKLSHAEVCRKYGISSTYAYKVKDRAIELLRQGIGRPVGRVDAGTEHLQKRIAELEQLAGDQALAIRALKKRPDTGGHSGGASGIINQRASPGPGFRDSCGDGRTLGGE